MQERAGVDMARMVALDEVEPDRFRNRTADPAATDRMYGGRLLGQATAAALATAQGAIPHAAHYQFMSAGRSADPVDYVVERTRDGRRFAMRQVEAWQDGRLLLRMIASLRGETAGEGLSHQAPLDAPPPEACEDYGDFVARTGDSLAAELHRRLMKVDGPVEWRHVGETPVSDGPRPPRRQFWFRLPSAAGIEAQSVHTALLAYLSDFWLAGTALIPHYHDERSNPAMTSLDHSLWVHRPPRVDEWMFHSIESPNLSGGVGLSRGLIHDRSGRLIASVVQEAVLG